MRKYKNIKCGIVLAALIAVLGFAAGCSPPPPAADITYPAQTGPGTAGLGTSPGATGTVGSITVTGTVESVERRSVYTTVGDIISQVNVEVGDAVTAGQVLALVTMDRHDADILIAESARVSARVELETVENLHERFEMLFNEGAISELEYRQSADALTHARNNYRHAGELVSALRSAQGRQLARQRIVAPIDGVVTAIFAREGEIGFGPLFIIEDIENLRVRTRFREYDLANIRVGMDVVISADATGDAEYAGVISRINPAAVLGPGGTPAHIVEFEAEVTITSPVTGLRIGMTARLNIPLE